MLKAIRLLRHPPGVATLAPAACGVKTWRRRLAKPMGLKTSEESPGRRVVGLRSRIFIEAKRLTGWEAMFDSGRREAIIASGQVVAPEGDVPPARRRAMRKKVLSLILVVAVGFLPLACTPTQRGAALGAGTGAAAGALLDHHKRTRGAAIGAVAGGVIGGLIGHTYEINKFCPCCGRRFHRSKEFCPYCGTRLQWRR